MYLGEGLTKRRQQFPEVGASLASLRNSKSYSVAGHTLYRRHVLREGEDAKARSFQRLVNFSE